MPRCGATFDENSVPLGQVGLQGEGFLNAGTNPPRRSATASSLLKTSPSHHPFQEGDFQGALHDPIRIKG